MKTSVFRFSLDVSQTQSQVSVSAGVGETGIRLIARLTENGAPFEIEPGSYAVFSAVKPDGQAIFNDCMIFSTGTVVYDFTEQTVALPGIVRCQIFVYAPDGTLIISPRLQLVVHENVYGKEIESTLEYSAIKKFVEEINAVNSALSANGERLSKLEDKITATGHITIPATEWTDTDPHDAFLQIPGDSFTNGGLLLLAPEDNETREACARARISVNLDRIVDSDPPFYDYVWFLRAESGEIPDSPLHFVYFSIRTGTENQEAVAAIIGVDAYGEGGGTGGGVDSAAVEEIVTRLVPGWARQEEPPEESDPTVSDWAKASEKPTYNKNEVGLSNVDNVRQYSASNPPPYPVTSVNGKIGAVSLTIPSEASDVKADPVGTASALLSVHNVSDDAHNDIRLLIEQHEESVNALLNSDDETLNETKEIVAYIKSNKSLIDSITGSKVNVTDIINNLTTNVTSKPLSAAQGVALKALIDALGVSKLDASKLTESVNTALAQAKASGEFDGEKGDPGASVTVSNVTTSSADGGSNVVTFSDGKTLTVKNGSKGSPGATGKSAYAYAKDGGYAGTEAEFGVRLARDYDTMIAQKLPINQGAANVGKILVVGTDGNLTLADMPEGGAIGDVVGVLDESNNILLSGELADGIYTLKWLKADGTYEDAGTLEVGEVEPVKTNFADPTSADWVKNARINGTGAASTDMFDTDYASNFIACQNGDVIRIENADITQEFYMCFYNAVQTKIQIAKYAAAISNSYVTNVTATATNAELTVNVADTSFMRFSLRDVADPNNVKIYVQRNGKWL